MDEELYYDYSVGLNTPYWIQEIRTPKGKLLTYFSTPMELSFLIMFALIFAIMIFLTPLISVLANISFGLANMLYFYAPYRLARLYCEFEPDGKKMHAFLVGVVNYMLNFRINQKAVYQGRRIVEQAGDIIFKKVNL